MRGRGLTARLEKLRDGGVVHGESTYLFKLSLQSRGRSEMDPGETPCSKDRGRRAPAGARTHEPRAVLKSFDFAESDVELALSSSPSS